MINEHQFQMAFEAAQLGLWQLDLATGVLDCTAIYKANLGLSPETHLTYEAKQEMILPEDRNQVQHAVQQALEEHTVYKAEYRVRWPDGTIHWIQSSGRGIYGENGEPVSMAGITLEITERKEIEEQLREKEEWSHLVLESTDEGIYGIDTNGMCTFLNRAGAQMLGYKLEETTGKNMHYVIHHSHRDGSPYPVEACPIFQAFQRKQGTRIDNEVLWRKDGTSFSAEYSSYPVLDNGNTKGAVITFQDITKRRQAIDALEQARVVAEEANRAKSAFLATMSHEIRTPMNAIIGMTSLLLDTSLTSEQRDYAETVRASSDALLTIINDILDFSKIEAGKLDLERQPFDLRECVESALDLLANRVTEKGIDLAYLLDNQVPAAIYGDVTRLRQILVNLLSNAVKFTVEGEVVLSVKAIRKERDGMMDEQDSDRLPFYELHFAVRDTGIGISEEGKARLFKSFSQVDASTTRRYGGTGLGLAICKRLTEMMSGTMWVESQPGFGSTFHFTILAQAAPNRPRFHIEHNQPNLAGKRLLIVDDNATNRTILRLQTQVWGMLPYECASGEEALAQVQAGVPFDVAILDMQMPNMDGIMLAKQIRHYRSAQELPLVMFTSLGQRDLDGQGVEFVAFLHKPIKPSQLYNVLIPIFVEQEGAAFRKADVTEPTFDTQLGQRLPLRILLAEDNTVNQKLALRVLGRMGYLADVAANGLEVLQALERQSYDVILMDVQMPEMDGLQASQAIHEGWPAEQRPRIIAMTANAMQGNREECLSAGMDDYLTKPIQIKALQEALERTGLRIKERVRGHRQSIKTGPLTHDYAMQEASVPALDPAALSELRQLQEEGEPDIVQELGQAFQFETLPLLQAMREAVEAGQAEKLKLIAHNIKGSSKNLGASVIASLSTELEAIGKNGTVAGAAQLLPRLEQEYQRVCQALVAEGGGVA